MPLTTPILSVEMPSWLYARTHRFLGLTGLIVYRSVAVKTTDPIYRPVRRMLDTEPHSVLSRTEVEDKDMMFGLAELSMYALGAIELAAAAFDEWLLDLQHECQRFLEL